MGEDLQKTSRRPVFQLLIKGGVGDNQAKKVEEPRVEQLGLCGELDALKSCWRTNC